MKALSLFRKAHRVSPLLSVLNILAISLFCALTGIAASAQTFTMLADFNGSNGSSPRGALTQGTDGNLYGAAIDGGSTGICYEASGCGTIFKATTAGALTVMHEFGGPEGAHPPAAPVLGNDGNFYGTTNRGGTHTNGTFFEMIPDGTVTPLYNFAGAAGMQPSGGLALGFSGNFYGSAAYGGTYLNGAIFGITPTGGYKRLYSFCAQSGCPDGQVPQDGLVQASDGNFYGVTPVGGPNKFGTIFKITPAGGLTTLYAFCSQTNCADGATPNVSLVQGRDGNLYGTTEQGGAHGYGEAFRITRTGTFQILHSFCAQPACADGANPQAGLVLASDGSFYGTTSASASGSRGTIFRVTSQGILTRLYSFLASDGQFPGQLTQATDGNFYGTLQVGGTSGVGTFFTFSNGLGPFVKSVESAGKPGATVIILGNNLTGTANVAFNGKSASFTVVSDTEVTATVPARAMTGAIQVTVAPNTSYSTVTNFKVLP